MAWEHLSINKPHLVYIILGGFTSIFMLCSSIIKEQLYIGEATVATICGIIFGPHAADLINPDSWGNVDQITLEFSRIVLVVQCFAVGVELPKAYMEKHWRSVVFLLVPVMTFGWLITSLFIWAVFYDQMNWLDCLVCAACVTATDPVLASSVVGKGKFAKRVPKHLRDLLSAESGCNDGMAFPFIYLGIYLVRYRPDANEVAFHWFCFTILYECIFGAVYGVVVGYIARRAIRAAHEHDLIDRESFLVFYFVLALFCAGSGSLLGMDDLLVGFACGVGFSNDGWFQEKTEESHVSNVIDLLINLAFFVYFGTIIPWNLYSSDIIGVTPWKLVVIAILVLFFRRIPIMLMLKPAIPDIKTWREALFAGHFGPIGVGALFVAILARAEFETETTTPLAKLPPKGFEHRNIIELIWPITTFLVITSIIVHGSSIAVFTLGRHINTLTFTMSYTQANENMNWMDRLPRIQSRSKSSMSLQKTAESSQEDLEKAPVSPGGALAVPKNLLRRQREEDSPSRPSSMRHSGRRKKWDSGIGPGGHVEQSAIGPQPSLKTESPDGGSSPEKVESDTTAVSSDESPVNEEAPVERTETSHHEHREARIYQEGDQDIVENEDGEIMGVVESHGAGTEEEEQEGREDLRREVTSMMRKKDAEEESEEARPKPEERIKDELHDIEEEEPKHEVKDQSESKPPPKSNMLRKLSTFGGSMMGASAVARRKTQPEPEPSSQDQPQRRQVPARAFKFGNTVIVEDEDGEVIKKYDLPQKPRQERRPSYVDPERTKQSLRRMGKWMGLPPQEVDAEQPEQDVAEGRRQSAVQASENDDDDRIRFTMAGSTRRMSKADFIKQIQGLDPRSRAEVVEESNAPETVKKEARAEAIENEENKRKASRQQPSSSAVVRDQAGEEGDGEDDGVEREDPQQALRRIDSATDKGIPVHAVAEDVRRLSNMGVQTAAERRRRATSQSQPQQPAIHEEDSDDDGTERVPPRRTRTGSNTPAPQSDSRNPRSRPSRAGVADEQEETAAERRRRLGALGVSSETSREASSGGDPEETAAERRRRLGALGVSKEDSDEDENESSPRQPPRSGSKAVEPSSSSSTSPRSAAPKNTGIRFADQAAAAAPAPAPTPAAPAAASESKPKFGSIRWGSNKGR